MIIPKISSYLLKLDQNTKSSSLNTILVISGGHDAIMIFYENFVNYEFTVILVLDFSCGLYSQLK